jgi:hypothetical protein
VFLVFQTLAEARLKNSSVFVQGYRSCRVGDESYVAVGPNAYQPAATDAERSGEVPVRVRELSRFAADGDD